MEQFVLEELYDFLKLSIISVKIVSLFVCFIACFKFLLTQLPEIWHELYHETDSNTIEKN